MKYRVIYSKPNSDGYPMVAHFDQLCDARQKAVALETAGYLADIWEDSNTGSRQIYGGSVGDKGVKGIAAAAGMSCRKLAERFGIPYRTMEDWSSGKRTPPDYVLAMMREILGI